MAKKIFQYRGKTLEDLQKLSMSDLLNYLPARARRSLKRGLTEDKKKLLNKIKEAKAGNYKKKIKTHLRDMVILPEMVGTTIHIYNGKQYYEVSIIGEMIGSFLGEYALTRNSVKHSAPGIGATKSSAAVSVK